MVEEAGQVVRPSPDLDRLEDLGVLQRDRHLGREQLDELELVDRERIADPEPLEGDDADRAVRRRSGVAMMLPSWPPVVGRSLHPRVVALVADVDRLLVGDDPRGDAGLARFPGSR